MKKIRVKWIGGICLLLFLIAFFTSPLFVISPFIPDVNHYDFFESIKNRLQFFDDEIDIFWPVIFFLFPVIIFLFSYYKTEKRIATGNFSFKRLIIFNLIITFALYGILFFPLMFMHGLFRAFGSGGDFYLILLIIIPPLLVVFFSVLPSLFLLKFNKKPKVLSLALWFFFFVTFILFLNTSQYIYTCGNYEYPFCLAEKAFKDNNYLLCDKAKDDPDYDFSARDTCQEKFNRLLNYKK